MIADVRVVEVSEEFLQGRKVIVYELEEAPYGHGGLPRPRDTQSDCIGVVKETPYAPGCPIFKEYWYHKEWREHWSEPEDRIREVCIYQVWVPDEWQY